MARRARGCVGRSSGRWGAVPQRRAMTSWETEPRAGWRCGSILPRRIRWAVCSERPASRDVTGEASPGHHDHASWRHSATSAESCFRIAMRETAHPPNPRLKNPAHRSAKGKPCFAGLSHLWERGGHHRGITRTGSGGHIGLTGDRENGLVERKAFRQPLPCVRRLLTPGQGPHFHPGRGFRTRPARPWSRSAWCRQRKQGTCTARNRASPVTAASSASPLTAGPLLRGVVPRARSGGPRPLRLRRGRSAPS